MSKPVTKYLNRNATDGGTQYKKGTEITSTHPMYESFLADGRLVDSQALAMNEPVALATSLDQANVKITQLQEENKALQETIDQRDEEILWLRKDLKDSVAELQKATDK